MKNCKLGNFLGKKNCLNYILKEQTTYMKQIYKTYSSKIIGFLN